MSRNTQPALACGQTMSLMFIQGEGNHICGRPLKEHAGQDAEGKVYMPLPENIRDNA